MGSGGSQGGQGGQGEGQGGGQAGFGLEGEKAYDEFGTSVALSSDGTRVVIGAPLNDGMGVEAGHARVFEGSGTNWVQLGVDLDGEAAGDHHGTSVAISANGNRVAVLSYLSAGGGPNSGSVRVYDYAGGVWTQIGADIDGAANAFQSAVAISGSGHRVVIGGPGNSSARVFELTAGAWVQVGATISQSIHDFARAVSISADGNRIAVGEPGSTGRTRPGYTYVYDLAGTSWTLVGAAIAGEALNDGFGTSVSLSADGSVIAVGANRNVGQGLDGGGIAGGHARVYRLVAGTWTQVGADLDGLPGDNFGWCVSLSGDGTRLMATGQGGRAAVRHYTLVSGAWSESTTPSFVPDPRHNAVAISADGHTAAVGATYYRGVAGAASGVVRLYTLP